MKKLLTVTFAALLALAVPAAAQNTNMPAQAAGGNSNAPKKRGPVFRATKEQIKQAQTLLKQRGLYAGDATGKLDPPTREGLKKFQESQGIKVTGTLNAATLQKMNITLTENQKVWVAAHG
ncbi:MAG TPA: peptidoglycan-binding domain-containing protein [Pyrinomonadaceae bacterium]|nr:peptidoglycan-binding domain-containing protein [Pyrinomonadaceae bacterium]